MTSHRGTADTEMMKAKGKRQKAKVKDEKPAVSCLPFLPFAFSVSAVPAVTDSDFR